MKTINYKLADGKTVEVEVSDEVAAAIEESDKYIELNERRETRRHLSYSRARNAEGEEFDFADPSSDTIQNYEETEDYNALRCVVNALSPNQQKIVALLENGFEIDEIAAELGTTADAVYKARNRLRTQMKKLL